MCFPVIPELRLFLRSCRPRRLRSLLEFAEAEIVIPDGQYAGQRFKASRQPYAGLFLRALQEGREHDGEPKPWRRVIALGPTQSGKTLCAFVVPLLYHLFEWGETVICVVPNDDIIDDKWRQDIRPAIHRSRYRDLLPVKGEGARGGKVRNAVEFGNGAVLKFMTTGGNDQTRAAFTARVAVITELNAFGVRKGGSEEADMFRQVQGRLRSYGDRAVIYGECTVSTETGLVWTEYQAGTESRIAVPCRHCEEYVTPGREHLVGWEDGGSVVEAEALARWVCPACGVLWTEQERVWSVQRSVLLHGGEKIVREERGKAIGC